MRRGIIVIRSLRGRSAILSLVSVVTVGFVPQPASAAGLFDFLFGGFSAPQPRYDYGTPLDVRVNPERRAKKVTAGPRAEHKPKLQTSIDPVKNPSWYLDDPTLRRGDIVVLKGRALVYDGGRGARSTDDFTPIQKSTLVSKGDRDKVEKMSKGNAGLTTASTDQVGAPAAKEAALR